MSDEYRGTVQINIAAVPVQIRYRVIHGSIPHIMDAYVVNESGTYLGVSMMPDTVRVRIYDAITADVREQEVERLRDTRDHRLQRRPSEPDVALSKSAPYQGPKGDKDAFWY